MSEKPHSSLTDEEVARLQELLVMRFAPDSEFMTLMRRAGSSDPRINYFPQFNNPQSLVPPDELKRRRKLYK